MDFHVQGLKLLISQCEQSVLHKKIITNFMNFLIQFWQTSLFSVHDVHLILRFVFRHNIHVL